MRVRSSVRLFQVFLAPELGTPQNSGALGSGGGRVAFRRRGDAEMPPIRVLNVAEKPSVAKEVSRVLSNGRASMREGQTPWNKIWEFEHRVQGQQCRMVFTSVTGHLMNLDFTGAARKWGGINARELIDGAPVEKMVSSGKEKTAENLRREARNAAWLILWLDCDREGENIAFEVMDVCRGVKPTLRILRARFSALSHNDVTRALNALVAPNENESKAVDMRQELDLRLGASFTRFNTMLLQNRFRLPGANEDGRGAVVSYGPCQFPTLGFIVQRKWDQARSPYTGPRTTASAW
jgi:DNA topoisomerase III